ncbi:MAG TPA: DUF1707 domain-containing protein [Nocardioides sp.]|uniref:DUF1707 SHOCT-like domain-containing protein n=1 Tax=Nocardioides sp. TaxID=35761 RepID=UPI002B8497AE|nr:DUF1707 domain-containing protein [Nocardioides sp.]HQR27978.1 DUF1707 domain-containing protein [Nocardioides sp.]
MSHPRRQQGWDRMLRQAHEAWPALASFQVQVVQGNVRLSDAERDAAAHALGEHFAAGRLEREEYDQRLDVVLAARTRGELAKVFRDLPGPLVRAPRPAPPAVRHRPPRRIPFLPVLLILVGLAFVLDTAWVLVIGLGVFLLARHGVRQASMRDRR